MALKVINNINGRLKFPYRKNRYLTPYIKRLLCNALIQPYFEYACSAWHPNLNQKFRNKLQTVQSKCIRYCLEINNRDKIGMKNFLKILKDLISTFALTLFKGIFKGNLSTIFSWYIWTTWSKSSKSEIFCFETKTSFKRHVFWWYLCLLTPYWESQL